MINAAIIGIGGHGKVHLAAVCRLHEAGRVRLKAVADPCLERQAELVSDLRRLGIACHIAHDEMLASNPDLDMVCLPLPIPLHAPLTLQCLSSGFHVLVEKPPAGCVADTLSMSDTAQSAERHCGVAFQYTTSSMVETLCAAIACGKLGRILDVSAMCLAQRPDAYYQRAPWTGRIAVDGRMVRDGSLNNPFAHVAHLLLYFAGAARGHPARPRVVTSELFAGHDIESEDTCALQAILDNGATLHFCSSLCSREDWTIRVRVTGTKGVFTWNNRDKLEASIAFDDGRTEILPNFFDSGARFDHILANFVEVLEGRASRLACPVRETLSFAELVEQAFLSADVVHLHGTRYVEREAREKPGETRTYLAGIKEAARNAFERRCLFSAVGLPWAVRRKT